MTVKKVLIISVFVILSIITLISIGFAFYLNNKDIIEPVYAIENMGVDEIQDLYVEVKGAVKKPGVYKVEDNTIINDVINLAGGFSKNAYTKNINLSKKIKNELVIYVFTKTEYSNKNKSNTVTTNKANDIITSSNKECTSNGYLIDNCTSDSISIITSSDEVEPAVIETKTDSGLLNINTASLTELTTLPGIGESKATAIIEYRSNNHFNSISDLLNVTGISEKTYEKLQNLITV